MAGVLGGTIGLLAQAVDLSALAPSCAAILDNSDHVSKHCCRDASGEGVRRRFWRIVQLTKELIATLWIRF